MISAVINTLNEEKNIERCLETLSWVDEIVVCDDGSTDKTLEIAKKFGAKIYHHKSAGFVEAARNFAVRLAQGDWILVIDADEEIPSTLANTLKSIAEGKNHKKLLEQQIVTKSDDLTHVLVPRKNIIFGKWIEHSGWWPDYQIRFFKKGKVKWTGKIHEDPKTLGVGCSFLPNEDLAIIHHNYQTIGQFIERMNRYTDIEAKELTAAGYKFNWLDLIKKSNGEFFNRFFAQAGFKDGLHGLILASLQSLSFFVTYIKVWELQGAAEQKIELRELWQQTIPILKEFKFWLFSSLSKETKGAKKLLYKFLQKLR